MPIESQNNLYNKQISIDDQFYLNFEIYNDELRKITKNYNLDLINLSLVMPKNENFYVDSIHHSAAGLEFISDTVLNYFVNNCELIIFKNACKKNLQ